MNWEIDEFGTLVIEEAARNEDVLINVDEAARR
jgi:hypothetical protein